MPKQFACWWPAQEHKINKKQNITRTQGSFLGRQVITKLSVKLTAKYVISENFQNANTSLTVHQCAKKERNHTRLCDNSIFQVGDIVNNGEIMRAAVTDSR